MRLKKIMVLVLAVFVCMNFVAYANENEAADYSKPAHWLALPTVVDKKVDVFFLYPTSWQKTDKNEPNICKIDNPSMVQGANAALSRQATAFETVGNIYAPYYRQADAVYTLTLPLAEQEKVIGGIPKSDVFAAFDYYIKHYNQGRPFILASHSQGSDLMRYILSEYMKEHPAVYKRMIAAYVIGYSITEDYLVKNPHLKFAEGPDDTGVIISYNTEAPEMKGKNPVTLPGGISINPITWTREETVATASESLGSRLLDKEMKWVLVKNYADARVDKARGVVICSTADVETLSPGNQIFPKGVFHSFDYPFYYYNIRENAANRTEKFLASQLSAQTASYPAAAKVRTTLESTVVPVAVPETSPKLLPNEVSQYAQYGYGVWQTGKGLPFQKRLDLMPSSYSGASVKNKSHLLRFFTMSDIHITDFQSPAQTIYFGLQGEPGMSSAYSPVILYTTQVLDAAVQTVNALNKKKAFDFGLLLGDAVNNAQYNELRWYIDVLDGKTINPNSDLYSTATNDYLAPYKAAGLDKSIPWYQARGNHDHFWSGVFAPNDYLKQTLVGQSVLNIDKQLTSDAILNTRGFYMGVVDGSTPLGEIVKSGPEGNFSTPPLVNANPDRRWISRNDWIAEFFKTSSSPVGHGFSQENAKTGFACYTFDPKAKLPIKVIVLDDTENDDTVFGTRANGASGALDPQRYAWLMNELDKGQAEGKLMIIAAHAPIGVGPLWDSASSPTEAALIAKLHTYSNLIMWVSGHRHFNTVTALKSPDPNRPELGFWVVETASLRDFPQQFRTFDIVRNIDNTLSVFVTDVDPAVTEGSPAAKSRAYAVATGEIFKAAPPYSPTGAYNAELVKQLSAEMQNKVKNLGTPIRE